MKKFLVIQTASIGDVILATAVVEKLHAYYPDSQIDMVIKKGLFTHLIHWHDVSKTTFLLIFGGFVETILADVIRNQVVDRMKQSREMAELPLELIETSVHLR